MADALGRRFGYLRSPIGYGTLVVPFSQLLDQLSADQSDQVVQLSGPNEIGKVPVAAVAAGQLVFLRGIRVQVIEDRAPGTGRPEQRSPIQATGGRGGEMAHPLLISLVRPQPLVLDVAQGLDPRA